MATNLTGTTIAATYDQLLHIDGGPTATPKTVYSGTGTATAMKLGTVNVEFENIRIDDNTISTINTNGNLNFAPNGTGSVVMSKVAITGGSIIGITDRAIADGGTGASTAGDARTNLGLGTMATQNSGAVAITGGSISGIVLSVSYDGVTGRDHGIFYDVSNQTFTANTATTIEFDTIGIESGITIENNGSGNPTRITFANAGTYEVSTRLQFINVDNNDHDANVWFRLNNTDIPNSATEFAIPKSSDGGKTYQYISGILVVTAGQYIETVVAVDNVDLSLHTHAALTTPYVRPVIPSAILTAKRIA
jgi:hypothetical protein